MTTSSSISVKAGLSVDLVEFRLYLAGFEIGMARPQFIERSFFNTQSMHPTCKTVGTLPERMVFPMRCFYERGARRRIFPSRKDVVTCDELFETGTAKFDPVLATTSPARIESGSAIIEAE